MFDLPQLEINIKFRTCPEILLETFTASKLHKLWLRSFCVISDSQSDGLTAACIHLLYGVFSFSLSQCGHISLISMKDLVHVFLFKTGICSPVLNSLYPDKLHPNYNE